MYFAAVPSGNIAWFVELQLRFVVGSPHDDDAVSTSRERSLQRPSLLRVYCRLLATLNPTLPGPTASRSADASRRNTSKELHFGRFQLPNWPLESAKVKYKYANRKTIFDFTIVDNSNVGPICHQFVLSVTSLPYLSPVCPICHQFALSVTSWPYLSPVCRWSRHECGWLDLDWWPFSAL